MIRFLVDENFNQQITSGMFVRGGMPGHREILTDLSELKPGRNTASGAASAR